MTRPATFELATTDQLTGLLTADYFNYLLREEVLPKAQEHDEPFSLFALDLDGLMTFNRTHGRPKGDEVILQVARVLQELVPNNALVMHYRGDEFGGVFPEMRVDDAFSLLEEVRRQVAGLGFTLDEHTPITCSIGLAGFPAHGKHEVELMRQADEALYLAKTGGRNKIALPPSDSRMVTKTSYYTQTQLERLATLAKTLKRNEATLLREALDDVLKKYNDRLKH
jgi:diguanylate cyclase